MHTVHKNHNSCTQRPLYVWFTTVQYRDIFSHSRFHCNLYRNKRPQHKISLWDMVVREERILSCFLRELMTWDLKNFTLYIIYFFLSWTYQTKQWKACFVRGQKETIKKHRLQSRSLTLTATYTVRRVRVRSFSVHKKKHYMLLGLYTVFCGSFNFIYQINQTSVSDSLVYILHIKRPLPCKLTTITVKWDITVQTAATCCLLY